MDTIPPLIPLPPPSSPPLPPHHLHSPSQPPPFPIPNPTPASHSKPYPKPQLASNSPMPLGRTINAPNPLSSSDIDRFATLFAPSTPPGTPTTRTPTPTYTSIFDPTPPSKPIPSSSSHARHHHHHRTPAGSADSDFGAFVSVPPSQDPLSVAFASTSGFSSFELDDDGGGGGGEENDKDKGKDKEVEEKDKDNKERREPERRDDDNAGRHALQKRSSLDFFDRFTGHAKKAAEKSRQGVLAELLEHEDDPMYFVRGSTPPLSHPQASHSTSVVRQGRQDLSDMRDLVDAVRVRSGSSTDVDTLREQARPPSPSPMNTISSKSEIQRRASPSPSHPPFPLSPTRPSHPRPSTPTSASSSTSPPPLPHSQALPPHTSPTNTFSKLSASWMSSFLTSSRGAVVQDGRQNQHGPSSLESLFGGRTGGGSSTTSTTTSTFSSHSSSHSHFHAPHLTYTSPLITHTTPFAPAPYFPPSGAPGFAGEDRSWGGDHVAEMMRKRDESGKGDGFDDDERSVGLVGRREMTVGVLWSGLADLLLPHLPVLPRLSRTWTLLYSLDQHGISLNTLYTRCETQLIPLSAVPAVRSSASTSSSSSKSTSGHSGSAKSSASGGGAIGGGNSAAVGAGTKGALVVVKDAGENVFGAWIGEGVRRSKGAYYGSGESFLWRYSSAEGKVDVYGWTGRNEYVALCDNEYISFGGGDGQYGLYLDETLLEGSSAWCPTFENEPLCPGKRKGGKSVPFECVGLEVWGVGPT